jgi:hypothetical protein
VGETADTATANRTVGLSQGFERAKGMDLDRVAAEIHRAIDEHISIAVSPKAFDPKAVQERLRRLLGAAANGGPYAFSVGSRNDRHLVIAYAVQKGTLMGPGATSVTVRVYAPREGRFAFVGATGDDMDGYGSLNVAELHSPVSNDLWLLIWGQMTGANGPNIRMRIYAYDRAKFRPK